MLQAREALRVEFGKLHRAMLAIVRGDEVCRRLMTVPGVGALVAITFTSGVDAPERFARSKGVGAHFGLVSGSPLVFSAISTAFLQRSRAFDRCWRVAARLQAQRSRAVDTRA